MKNFTNEEGNKLVEWYNTHKRSLPWRDTGNPYHVWISEIMLQQTRIEAVKEKYKLFIQTLPDVASLAKVDDDALMKLWEGLGYYSRARSLKKAALVLHEKYHDTLPESYEELVALPGIGPYTAGAIASIAFDKPASAVDGNVLRVVARLRNDERDVKDESVRKEVQNDIRNFLETKSKAHFVSSFNQGLMELGETICLPNTTPHCARCPLASFCIANKLQSYDRIPYRSKLKDKKIIQRTIFVVFDGEKFLLHKRNAKGLLASLYEFIGTDTHMSKQEAVNYLESLGFEVLQIHPIASSKHIFTHLEWHMIGYEIKVSNISHPPLSDAIFVTKKELTEMAVPSAFKTYLRYCEEKYQDF